MPKGNVSDADQRAEELPDLRKELTDRWATLGNTTQIGRMAFDKCTMVV